MENSKKLKIQKLYSQALKYLSYRPLTIKQLRDKLEKKFSIEQNSKPIIEETIAFLLEQKLLDDYQYCDNYIRYRLNTSPQGEYKLQLELRQKGVNQKIIQQYFAENPFDEFPHAQKLALLRPKLDKIKLMRYLQGRGFSLKTIKKCHV